MFGNYLFFNLIILLFCPFLFLWFLTKLLYYNTLLKQNQVNNTVFECGFKTLSLNVIKLSLNSLLILVFILLYEFEIVLLVPFLLAILNSKTFLTLLIILLFIIILTLFLDF